jgi:tetratricopeptide (TPR) repeat protein
MSSSKKAGDRLTHDHYKAEGDDHTKARRFEEAEGSYTWAISVEYTQHATWGNRSLVRLKLGNVDGAAHDAQRCTELAPDWPKGWARLGAAERARNHPVESARAYRKAHELEPSNKEFIRLLHEVEAEIKAIQSNHHNQSHQQHLVSSTSPSLPIPQKQQRSVSAPVSIGGGGTSAVSTSTSTKPKHKSSTQLVARSDIHHLEMKPLPKSIPLDIIDTINTSIVNNPKLIRNRHKLCNFNMTQEVIDNAFNITQEAIEGGGIKISPPMFISTIQSFLSNGMPSFDDIQSVMTECLEQLPANERSGLDRTEQVYTCYFIKHSSFSFFLML